MKKLTIIAFFMALFANMTFAAEVNVFSARHYDSDKRFGNSTWRWTYDYKVVGDRDISDLDDKPFVRKRRIRNRTISIMYCNFFIGFFVLMSFISKLLILILQ